MVQRPVGTRTPDGGELLRALHETTQRLQMIIHAAPVVLWAFDRDGIFTLVEGKGLRALGARARASVGHSVHELYGGYPDVLEAVRRVLAGEEFTIVQDVDGVVFESLFSPLRDERQEVVGAMGVSTDITERRLAERDLRANEQKCQRIFHDSPSPIAINRKSDGRYVDVNAAFLELVQRERDEVIGRTPAEIDFWIERVSSRSWSTGSASEGWCETSRPGRGDRTAPFGRCSSRLPCSISVRKHACFRSSTT